MIATLGLGLLETVALPSPTPKAARVAERRRVRWSVRRRALRQWAAARWRAIAWVTRGWARCMPHRV